MAMTPGRIASLCVLLQHVQPLPLVAAQTPADSEPADSTEPSTKGILRRTTFDWTGGDVVAHSVTNEEDDIDEADDARSEDPDARRLQHGGRGTEEEHSEGDKAHQEQSQTLVKAVWDRPQWRDDRFNLTHTEGEHPCFSGFKSMMATTNRCNGWMRQYPEIGGKRVFRNTGIGGMREFTLEAVVAEHINIWLEEETTTEQHKDIAIKAARIYTNEYNIPELRPAEGVNSWMEQECKVMGSMPFMYTCSNRIQILVQQCNKVNAWVMQSDYLQNFPGPANNMSNTNHDIVFYMCKELIDSNPNPYAAATTFAHELAHVIQGGFGFSFGCMTEGGATWLEGPLLNLPPRPIVYAWGFRDWNHINAAHLYATSVPLNSRKFYQIHAMFLTYLSQPALLGNHGASALQNYQTFARPNVPWGRMAYDYFFRNLGEKQPNAFATVDLDINNLDNAFANALLDYRVAIISECISEERLKPKEARYSMPKSLHGRPYWDCTSFPVYWSAEQSAVEEAGTSLHYGGAAFYRLATPENPTVFVQADADPNVRTKVLAAGSTDLIHQATVVELAPGDEVTFEGSRDIYVVQVNVDPAGEVVTNADLPALWHRSSYRCTGLCQGQAWTIAYDGKLYPPNEYAGLLTPTVELPINEPASLSFLAMWDMERADVRHASYGRAKMCQQVGYDGVQVRIHDVQTNDVEVIKPQSGTPYATGGDNESTLVAFATLSPGAAECVTYDGWTGSSGTDEDRWTFKLQTFSLARFAGRSVRVEILFASDSGAAGEGFWLNQLNISTASQVIFEEDGAKARLGGVSSSADTAFSAQRRLPKSVTAGATGPAGVPVVAQLPADSEPDRLLKKASMVRSAAWGARWQVPRAGSVSSLRRAYLGYSYSSAAGDRNTAHLRAWQEACIEVEAPFAGHISSATLFTLVDKIGISSVRLVLRSPQEPFGILRSKDDSAAIVTSPSEGVADPGVHRFDLSETSPLFTAASSRVAVCIGIGSVKPLPADDPNMEPFLHLPLSDPAAGNESLPRTFLHATEDHKDQKSGTVVSNPWKGNTIALRAEFTEAGASSGIVLATQPANKKGESVDGEAEEPRQKAVGFLAYP
eukprot:TRINITY_DN8807_c0_g1_i4.p1 TRINITY_DN8807_c0_g1~~TRINITY_DN8807_c0_g1_i4.p1  ORF type:complete len:1098 (+),score=150.86 TRINITY_DN8807_c0_g1_i4:88-3381(+)